MTSWQEFESSEPALAAQVRSMFDIGRHKTLATIRSDGAPRISGIECEFADGQLRIGSMAGSRKGADLARDPRLAVHSPTISPTPGEESSWPGEAKISGSVASSEPMTDDDGVDHGRTYLVDITEVVVTRLSEDASRLVVEFWTPLGGRRVVERD